MTKKTGIGLAAMLCCAVVGTTVLAQPTAPLAAPPGEAEEIGGGAVDGHGGMHSQSMRGRAGQPHGAMASSWQATLSDDQRAEIGMSKLRMRQKQSLVEARIALKKAEIAQIVGGDEGSDARLQGAVDELMALEHTRTLDHYRHLMEVRQLLTPKQRLSFDLGLVSGDAHGAHQGGGHGH